MATQIEPRVTRYRANQEVEADGTDNIVNQCESRASGNAAFSANPIVAGQFTCGYTTYGSPFPGTTSFETGNDLDFDLDALLLEEMELSAGLEGFSYGTNLDYTPDTPAQLYHDFNLVDPLLVPGSEPTMPGLDAATLGHSPVSTLPMPHALTGPSNDASPSSNSGRWSPFSTNSAISTIANELEITHNPYHCRADGCTKAFRKESHLKQHQRVHKKALVCSICRTERQTEHRFAQVRDLERHLQARHPDAADRARVRSEIRECPFPDCGYCGRRDNVSRHYESKHGGKLKWRKGVPTMVIQSGIRQDF